MKKVSLGILSILVVAGLCFSQTVNICGKVTDPNGQPLTHTAVRLGQATFNNGFGQSPYIAETDASGKYHLGTGTCTVNIIPESKQIRGNALSLPIYVGGKVLFGLPSGEALVKMGIYDLSGRFVRDVMNKRLLKGSYSVSIDTRGISSQFYLLRVAINGNATVVKLQPASRMPRGTVIRNAPEFESRLQKLDAVVDTLHAIEPGYTIGVKTIGALVGQYDFVLSKNNTWNGDVAAFWGDTSTYSKMGGINYVVLNRTNGAFPDSKIFWSKQELGTKVSLATQSMVPITGAGRFYIWIAPDDSGSRYYDVIEYNGGGSPWMGNTTRVDGWRLPICFWVHSPGGIDTTRGDAYEMFYQSRQAKFDEFRNEVPKEFTGLATQDFANIWAPHTSPVNYFGTGGPYENYYIAYEDSVNALHGGTLVVSHTITVFNCLAAGGGMGTQPYYSAALNRHVATLPQGTNYSIWNNDTNYYKAAPCNYYSKWCHRRSLHKLCYGTCYDDVGNHSSFVQQPNVQWIAIAIGW
jgi:hypothetical protein